MTDAVGDLDFTTLDLEAIEQLAADAFSQCADVLLLVASKERQLDRLGRLLTAAKTKVPHGEWDAWLQKQFGGQLAIRTARRWMLESSDPARREVRRESNRDRNADSNRPHVADLSGDKINHPIPQSRVEVVDPDPNPAPKTNTNHTAANKKASEATKPTLAPVRVAAEIVEPEIDPVAEWLKSHTLADVVRSVVQGLTDAAEKLTAAKQLRKLADELDPPKKFKPPTLDDVTEYCHRRNSPVDPEAFVSHYAANGWKLSNGNRLADWQAAVITWEKREKEGSNNGHGNRRNSTRAKELTGNGDW